MARVPARSALHSPTRPRRRARLLGFGAGLALLVIMLLLARDPSGSKQGRSSSQVLSAAASAAAADQGSSNSGGAGGGGLEQAQAAAGDEAAAEQEPAGEDREGGAASSNSNQQEEEQQQEDGQSAVAAEGSGSSGSTGGGGQGTGTGIFFTLIGPGAKNQTGPDDNPIFVELLDEPVPEDCHMEQNADYEGNGLSWGLEWKKASAAQCCQACKEFKPDGEGRRCNVWVWCGDPSGVCWTPDAWNHTTGECWLKYQQEWDNNVDMAQTNLKAGSRGMYTKAFRDYHKESPDRSPWTSGVIPAP